MNDPEAKEAQYQRFAGLLIRNEGSLRRFVRSLLPSFVEIDDLMQEIAIESWKQFTEFEQSDHPKRSDEFIRWTCTIARFKVLSFQRDASRDKLVFQEDVFHRVADTAMEYTNSNRWSTEKQAIEGCLKLMDDESRRLIMCVHVAGDSVAKIAEESSEIPHRLYRRLATLRSRLMECVSQRLAKATAE